LQTASRKALNFTQPVDNSKDTLYQRVLGEEFAHLSPALREFHGLPHGGQAQGVVCVRHGCGIIRHTVAKLLRLPPQGEHITVHLQVQAQAQENCETWVRHFEGVPVQTIQWQHGDLLIEKAGLLCFAFRVSNDQEGLRFDFSHNEIVGLRLPLAVLKIEAQARGLADGWHITVVIRAPFLGLLAEYQGEIRPC
jgi:hypothetical protein